jgi:hypothetical protein
MTDDRNEILAGLRKRERMLELEAASIRARLEEVREVIDRFEPGTRRGRPRKVVTLLDAADIDQPETAA